jgi:hypothetical protein
MKLIQVTDRRNLLIRYQNRYIRLVPNSIDLLHGHPGNRVRVISVKGRDFSLLQRVQTSSVAHRGFCPVSTGRLSGVKWQKNEALHPVPRVRMRRSVRTVAPCLFRAWSLIKHRDCFTFTYIVVE